MHFLLLLPFLVGTAVLVLLPVLMTFGLAFFDYDALSSPVWVGLENFETLLHERVFHISVQNSTFFVLTAVPLRILGALGLALLLYRQRQATGAYRAAVFLPTVVPDVAYAMIWLWIFNPLYGPLNLGLAQLGIVGKPWLVDPDLALPSIVFMSLFQVGEGFVLMLAALRAIPDDFYEAAQIDGATAWQSFKLITLPLVAPWMMLLVARDIAITLQSSFTAAYLMTGGGPYYSTFLLPILIFEEGFDRFRFGLASAMMIVVFVAVALPLLLADRVMKRWLHQDDF